MLGGGVGGRFPEHCADSEIDAPQVAVVGAVHPFAGAAAIVVRESDAVGAAIDRDVGFILECGLLAASC